MHDMQLDHDYRQRVCVCVLVWCVQVDTLFCYFGICSFVQRLTLQPCTMCSWTLRSVGVYCVQVDILFCYFGIRKFATHWVSLGFFCMLVPLSTFTPEVRSTLVKAAHEHDRHTIINAILLFPAGRSGNLLFSNEAYWKRQMTKHRFYVASLSTEAANSLWYLEFNCECLLRSA